MICIQLPNNPAWIGDRNPGPDDGKCCVGPKHGSPDCYVDGSRATLVAELVNVSGTVNPEDMRAATVDECLPFESFVRLLALAHQRGARTRLNNHYLPQDLACPAPQPGLTVHAGNISYMARVLNEKLVDYELNDVRIPHLHSSKTASSATTSSSSAAVRLDGNLYDAASKSVQLLCQISEAEYAALKIPRSRMCTHPPRQQRP